MIVTGVSGSGKTTIGILIAGWMNCRFFDGDDFHPPANVEKMKHGTPLTDEDRWPWLDKLREMIETHLVEGESVVVACSALREVYRQRLIPLAPELRPRVLFAYLKLPESVAIERVAARKGHFMPASLEDSQYATLEEPVDALVLDATATESAILAQAIAGISQRM